MNIMWIFIHYIQIIKQAYNNINRDQFTEIMKQLGIPSKLVRLVQNDNGKD